MKGRRRGSLLAAWMLGLWFCLAPGVRAEDPPLETEAQVTAELEAIASELGALNQGFLQMVKDPDRLFSQVAMAGRLQTLETLAELARKLEAGDRPAKLPELTRRGERVVERLRSQGVAGAEQLGAQLAQLRSFTQANQDLDAMIELFVLYDLGLYQTVAEGGEPLLARLDPENGARLRLTLVNAGYRGGRPELVRRHLPAALALAGQSGQSGLQLVAGIAELGEQLERDPDMPVDEFLRRHDRLWSSLLALSRPEVYVVSAVRDLILLAEQRLDRLPRDAAAPLTAAIERDVAYLESRAQEEWTVPLETLKDATETWDSKWKFTLLWMYLEQARRLREAGRFEEARERLGRVERELVSLDAVARRLEPLVQELFRDSGLTCNLWKGDFSRLPACYYGELARLSLEPGPASRRQVLSARALMEVSLELYRQAGDVRGPRELGSDYPLILARATGQVGPARALLQQNLAEAEKTGARPARIRARLSLGELLALEGRAPEAVSELSESLEELLGFLHEAGRESPEARSLRARSRSAFELLARLHTEAGRPEAALRVLDTADQVATFERVVPRPRTPQEAEALARFAAARRSLRGLESESETLAALPSTPERRQQQEATARLLAGSRAEFYQVTHQLYRQDPRYQQLAIRPINLAQAQRTLDPKAAVVQIFPSESELYLFFVTREKMKILKVPVGAEALDRLALQLRRQIVAQGQSGSIPEPLRQAATSLHRALVDPLEEDLQGIDLVAFIPTGSLLTVPLQAMARERGPDLEFLIERKQVVTLVRSSDLGRLQSAPARGQKLVAFGNPDGTLPGARTEVEELSRLFPDSTVWLENQATEDRLQALHQVGYLHLATHGCLTRQAGGNYLVMAGSDGKLSVDEITGLDLGQDIRLVTLSACQSALADPKPGSEMLSALADAFSYAGSPSVVASLWKVSDEATRELMVGFYRGLKAGQSRAAALQNAQKSLLAEPRFSAPFFWAPFILIGDWR